MKRSDLLNERNLPAKYDSAKCEEYDGNTEPETEMVTRRSVRAAISDVLGGIELTDRERSLAVDIATLYLEGRISSDEFVDLFRRFTNYNPDPCCANNYDNMSITEYTSPKWEAFNMFVRGCFAKH